MKQLVLIHGALGNGNEFNDLVPLLEKHFEIHMYEIPGHGKRKNQLNQFNLTAVTADLSSYLKNIEKPFVFGFSLGGYLALHLATLTRDHMAGIVLLGTKLEWSREVAQLETKKLNLTFLKEKAPSFYDYLRDLHGNHLASLSRATGALMNALGEQSPLNSTTLGQIEIPIHISRGGRDKMVTYQESIAAVECISNSLYFEIPSFVHPLGFLKPKHLAQHIIVQVDALDYKYAATQYGKIAYQEIGTPRNQEEPILLFLHEALGSIAQWQDFARNLSNQLGLSAIIPEMLGYGFSDNSPEKRTSNYLHQFAWEHIPAFLDTLGIQNKLLLVGHSDGGTEALLFASKFPERIHGLVTMAAHLLNEPETIAGIHPAIEAFEAGKLKGLEIYHGERTENVFREWSETWLSDSFLTWNIENDLKTGEFPSLIMQGDNDQYGTVYQVQAITKQLGKNSTPCYIPNSGHSPHLEQQDYVIQKIKTWNKQ